MRERLVDPLESILSKTTVLLQQTDLEDLHRRFLEAMYHKAGEMLDLVISIPDFTWARAREILSYESRSHLTAILGYAEELLEEPDATLNPQQRTMLMDIQANGQLLLHRLAEDIE